MKLSSALLKILVCPVTQDKLIYNSELDELISISAGLAYPIIDGIPILLESSSRKLNKKELEAIKKLNT